MKIKKLIEIGVVGTLRAEILNLAYCIYAKYDLDNYKAQNDYFSEF